MSVQMCNKIVGDLVKQNKKVTPRIVLNRLLEAKFLSNPGEAFDKGPSYEQVKSFLKLRHGVIS